MEIMCMKKKAVGGAFLRNIFTSVLSKDFSSVAQLCPTLCTPGLPVHHQLPEFTQTHVH